MFILKKVKGFSLVELAIVFVVMGVLLAVGIKMLAPMLGRAKTNETDKIVKAAVDSVVGYAAIEHTLPTTLADFEKIVTNSEDIWGNSLMYSSTDLEGDICNQSKADISVKSCFNASCANEGTDYIEIDNVALVVYSKGENTNLQTDDGDFKVYPKGTVIASGAYDDVVKWTTLNELRVKAGCSGAPLKILNNELPLCGLTSAGDSSYKATIYSDGGVGGNRWCREESAETGLWFFKCINSACEAGDTSISNIQLLSASAPCGWDAATSTETGTWMDADKVEIVATPSVQQGSFNITFFVHDNEGNVASKSLVTTLDPKCMPISVTDEIAEETEETAGVPDVYVCHNTCVTSCETVNHTCGDNSNTNGNGNMNGNSNTNENTNANSNSNVNGNNNMNSNGNANSNGNGNVNGNVNTNANSNDNAAFDCVDWTEEVCAAPVCTPGDLQISVADLATHIGHGDTLGACDSGIIDIDGDNDKDGYSDKDEYDCGSLSNSNGSIPPDSDNDGWCDAKDAYDNDNSQH